MLTENTATHTVLGTIGMTIIMFYQPLIPWMLLALALVLVDLRFGILASKRRGEQIRSSRAVRRTLNKVCDYFCWVTVAGLVGESFGKVLDVPVVSMGLLVLVYGIEISSAINNYFEYKGVDKKFNWWRLIHKTEVGKAVEDTIEDKSN